MSRDLATIHMDIVRNGDVIRLYRKSCKKVEVGSDRFIEGDLSAYFDKIDHSILLDILRQDFHDNRFIRLISGLLKAGYLEEWKYNQTYSGVPPGGVISPILEKKVLDKLDKYVESVLIPAYTRGRRRKTNPPYVAYTYAASKARKEGDLEKARQLKQLAQTMPSRDPNDPNFRRLWYVRYADDFLLGFVGTKSEAIKIKQQIAAYLRHELKLELNSEKTLVTHARDGRAKFLGYEVHILHANSKHDHRGQRCINGGIGLRVPSSVKKAKCAKYMQNGKPTCLPQRINDSAYSIVAQYQSEYRGVIQYYRMAYNLHTLAEYKWVMETSLVKTIAKKFNMSCRQIYAQYQTTIETDDGPYKVIQVMVERGPEKKPLVAYFGGISLRWNKKATIDDNQMNFIIWSGRSARADS